MSPQPEHRKTSENVLNAGVEITGTLKFSGELIFDGRIEGEIQTSGTLHLGDRAVIKGNINAQTVVVRGKINGDISATEKIDIKTNTELFGDIRASKLAMEEGVTFVGKTEIKPASTTGQHPPSLGRQAQPHSEKPKITK